MPIERASCKQLQIAGADVNVTGQGAIALNDTGASNLTLHADTPSLDRIGELIGQPLKGAAVVDATVTGNARELKADGTADREQRRPRRQRGVEPDEHLLSGRARPSVRAGAHPGEQHRHVPRNRRAEDQRAHAETTSSASRREPRYSQSRLDFKGVAKEGPRELAAGGWVVVHPDHHEVHIGDLALRPEQIEWRTPAGTSAAVQYAKDRIEVENLELANGDQRITANGVIAGRRFDASRARAKTWMSLSSTPCCSVTDGWLDVSPATPQISGTTRAPSVTSNFTLSQGAFRTFKFEALTGTVDYTRNGVAMDVRLQQTPTTWITAKGIAPLTLFQPTPPGLDPHDEDAGRAASSTSRLRAARSASASFRGSRPTSPT